MTQTKSMIHPNTREEVQKFLRFSLMRRAVFVIFVDHKNLNRN
jgi:hypothetical protein